MMRLLLVGVLMLGLGGCTWITEYFGGTDNTEPPKPLTELKPAFQVKELWSVDTGSGSGEQRLSLHPAVADNQVFVAGRSGKVMNYALSSGKQTWETDTKTLISAGPGVGYGLVVLGTRNAEVLALNQKDGKLAWRTRVSTEVLSVPAIGKDMVVVRTIDGRLTAINANTGKIVWDYVQREPSLTLRGTSSPVITDDIVISGFDNGKLVALSLYSGQVVWERVITVPRGRSELERLVDIDATPVVEEGVVYLTTYQGNVAAVSVLDGQLIWTRKMSSYAGLAIDKKQLYVTDYTSQIWAIYRSNGASLWKQDKLQWRSLTRPVVMGDRIVVADFEGYLHWLSQEDGRILARARGDSKGYLSAPVVTNDILLALGKSGELSAYKIAGKK